MEEIWDKYSRNSKGWLKDPIARVHPRIYLGSAIDVDSLIFDIHDITHAINCAEEEHSALWFKRSFPERYVCINAQDTLEYNITDAYPLFESTINKFLADPDCKNIYIHCQCGINRSAFLLLIYMCIKFGYSMDSVVKTIVLQRPCCFRNPEFRKQVTEYIKKLE